MKRLLPSVLIAAVLSLSATASPAATREGEPSRAELQERLLRLEEEMRRLGAELERLRSADPSAGADRLRQLESQVAEMARQLEILTSELERRQLGAAYGAAETSVHGLGPAASKVYGIESGVSIGGYGEMIYQDVAGTDDTLDFLRAVFYFGYKFNDRILFNSEIEFEHASTGEEGEVSVEFAYLDFLLRDEVNFRAGLLLLPVGFINELHEPPIFYGAARPHVERVILPTTWRENGAGVFGDLGPVSYRAYVTNGLDSSGFSASSGIRGGRQDGSRAQADDLALSARADWTIAPGLMVGASAFVGDAGQDETVSGEELDAGVTLLDLHAEWRWRGLQLRGLWSRVEIDDAEIINAQNGLTGSDSVGEELEGWYLEAGYDLLSHRDTEHELSPYVRYERVNTHEDVPEGFMADPALDLEILTFGLEYQPIPQVTFKVDYQDFENEAGTARDRFHVALGFLF